MNHTIIVIKTTKDKIIGGYTPLAFNPEPTQEKIVEFVKD
jgi:hypothetical protein